MEEEIREASENTYKEENISEESDISENKEDNSTLEDETVSLKKRIEELENEASDMKNKYMYAMAEAENVRKRAAKEKTDTIRRANKELLLSLLNFMDNFERALKAG